MQYLAFCRCGLLLFSMMTLAIFSYCLGQGTSKVEDSLPQELRNRSDVELIVQKLRFLRLNDSYFGQNHPNKKSTQAQISDYESALESIIELSSLPSPPAAVTKPSMKIEDCLPQEFRNRSDVEMIVQKLRFLRLSDSNFGEKHPNKKSTQLQIREQELALNSIIELGSSPHPKSAIEENSIYIEDLLSPELRDREDVQSMVLQLLFLRINKTSFRENHPDRIVIQEQIQKHESALLAKNKDAAKPAIRMRSTKADVTMMQELEDRKDVQIIVHKLTILRLNEVSFGEEHLKTKTIKAEIREQEASLIKIIRLNQRTISRSNPFRRAQDNESLRSSRPE